MRIEPFCLDLLLLASLAIALPATAQTSPRGDDAVQRSVTSAARVATVPGQAIERLAHDAVRLTARDYASIAAPVVMPYRSTPSTDVAPDGFSMRVPGTGLDLTNGSVSIRRNDARSARGFNFSVQLTY